MTTAEQAMEALTRLLGGESPSAAIVFEERWSQDQVNFITPTILGYWWVCPGLALELSTGEGFDHDPIFGLTFLETGETPASKRRYDLDSCAHTVSAVVQTAVWAQEQRVLVNNHTNETS